MSSFITGATNINAVLLLENAWLTIDYPGCLLALLGGYLSLHFTDQKIEV